MLESSEATIDWVAGVSIGSVNAAIIAGSPPEQAAAHLRSFWHEMENLWPVRPQPWFGLPSGGLFRQVHNEVSAIETLMFGRPGLFRPRLAFGERVGVSDVPALFDLAPLRRTLSRWVDVERLNAGPMRVSICCTDIIGGDRVVFDTGRGDRIGVEHIVASCALLPMFAPIELDGILLGDGALSGNTPLDVVLADVAAADRLCFIVELFAKAGQRPHTLAASANRATDLGFGHQTQLMLDGWERENRLRAMVARLGTHLPPELLADPEIAEILEQARPRRTTLRMIEYRGALDEAGLLKSFDFSKATLDDRWSAGAGAVREAWLGEPAGRARVTASG